MSGGDKKELSGTLRYMSGPSSAGWVSVGSTTVGILGCGKVAEDLGRVENFTGAKTLHLCPDPSCLDLYTEGGVGEGLETRCVPGHHRVTASPLNIAEGSMRPAAACAWAGSSIRLSRSDILLSDFICCSELLEVSVLFTTVEVELELVVVVELCCSICCFFFIS